MDSIMQLFLRFNKGSYSFRYRALSLLPGTIVFLGITPFFLFFISRFLGSFVAVPCPRSVEVAIALSALVVALLLMTWSLFALWIQGQGTPAPIAPTRNLVSNGPYAFCRNPIELGTAAYFLFIGVWFDGLLTGVLCLLFGLALGYGYIKIIEERELKLRFGLSYDEYLQKTPLFFPAMTFGRKKRHG